MSTAVRVTTFTHTVTFVTDRILCSVKEIVREIGLDPAVLTRNWTSLDCAISTWLRSGHLRSVILEISSPRTGRLVSRWDFDLVYDMAGDGSMWADCDEIRYHILKAGVVPASCEYRIMLSVAPGAPNVDGWGSAKLFSTNGFGRYTIGTTIDGNGIGSRTSYWRQ